MSGSEENSRIFGIQGDSRYLRKHYRGLGSILYDVTEDIIVDAVLGNCNDSERHFALRHLKKMEQYHLKDSAIIIFDRGYYGTIEYLVTTIFHYTKKKLIHTDFAFLPIL